MSGLLLQYMLESSVLIALFYGFYRLFLKSSTFYGSKRAYLLLTLAASFVLPLVRLPKLAIQPFVLPTLGAIEDVSVSGAERAIAIEDFLLVLAVVGTLLLTIRLTRQLVSLLLLWRNAERQRLCGYTVYSTPKTTTPFSFFSWIFLGSVQYDEDKLVEIVAHERIHATLLHSVDTLLFELATCLFWFNPAMWLLKREVKRNSEYQTDARILRLGYKPQHYQHTLLHVCVGKQPATISNGFNENHLKARIIMMNKQKSKKVSLLRYALLIPLVGLVAFFVSCKDGKPTVAQDSNRPSERGVLQPSGNQIITFDKLAYDFGTIRESDGDVSTIFTFVNNGKVPLLISTVNTSCGCTTPEWTKEPVAPGEKGYIKATYGAKGRVGMFEKWLTVYFSTGSVELKIEGNVVAE